MEDLWFEEELIPTESTSEEIVKAMPSLDNRIDSEITNKMGGIVRVNRPRWIQLKREENSFLFSSVRNSKFYLVRLGFEFDVNSEARKNKVGFIEARFFARLSPPQPNQPQPTVYELIPRDYYEDGSSSTGKLSTISIKLNPTIQLGPIQVSAGEVSKDILVGNVEPEIIGWSGDNECEPYWELRPKSGKLRGQRNLWLIVEVPSKTEGMLLAVQAQGILQLPLFGFLPIGPRIVEWKGKKQMLIV